MSWCRGGRFDEIEYDRQKKSVEWELESLLIPGVDAAKEAGRLLAGHAEAVAGSDAPGTPPTADDDPGCCLHRLEGQEVDRVGESETGVPGSAWDGNAGSR